MNNENNSSAGQNNEQGNEAEEFAMTYDDGYFAGEKFAFKDKDGNEINMSYEEMKDLALKNKANPNGGNPPAPGSNQDPNNDKTPTGENNDKGNGEGQAPPVKKENGGQFTPEELKAAKIQMDGKISNVMTIFKQAKGVELTREEINTALQAKHARGEEITLDTVDVIAEELAKEKKEAKEKELQNYIDEKKKEKSPLARSSVVVRDKTTQEEKKPKLDAAGIMDDFVAFRSSKRK